MKITIYLNFSRNKGNYRLLTILNGIKNGKWAEQINAMREAQEAGNTTLAEQIKRSLPAMTVSALYKGARRMENMTAYTGLIILDIDDLEADQVDPTFWKACDCEHTVFAFPSPGGRGLKIGVDPSALVDYPLTVDKHKLTFNRVKEEYERLLSVDVDPSGKDPGRLCFVSWAPHIYISERFLAAGNYYRLAGLPADDQTAPSAEEQPVKQKQEEKPPKRKRSTFKTQFSYARRQTNRRLKYEAGNRNNYVYQFSHNCKRREIPQDEVTDYCLYYFSDLEKTECLQAIRSAFEQAEVPEEKQKNKDNTGVRPLQAYLEEHYHLQYNVVLCRVEIRRKRSKGKSKLLDKQMLHTIWCDMLNQGIKCRLKTLEAVIHSHFVPSYDPFVDYFESLPEWDGVTDYILQLADTVTTTNQPLWRDCLRRWLVAMVGCATIPEVINHTVLMLIGPQGIGKTSWCCNLIPPALRGYIHSGTVDPRSKDARIALSECIEINLDELGALRDHELNQLKEMITSSIVRQRRPYAEDAETHPRRCSFTASTNNAQILNDPTGARRMLSFETLRINYLSAINYDGLYAQVVFLLHSGFKYWFDGDELDELNKNNEPYRIQAPEEELLFTYFRLPQEGDKEVLLLSSAQIMQQLACKAPLQITRQTTNNIAMILKREGFEQVRSRNRRLFKVVKLDEEEVERRRKHLPSEKEGSDKKTDNQNDIPFD